MARSVLGCDAELGRRGSGERRTSQHRQSVLRPTHRQNDCKIEICLGGGRPAEARQNSDAKSQCTQLCVATGSSEPKRLPAFVAHQASGDLTATIHVSLKSQLD